MSDPIAQQFVLSPAGGIDFGEIDAVAAAAISRPPGPVRLQNGFEGPKGFGNRHVEAYAQRMKQLRGMGYNSFAAFAYDVSRNYMSIGEAEAGRLFLIYPKRGYDLRLVITHRADETEPFWGIVTGIPSRVARCPILYQVTRTGGSEPTPDVARRPRFATLSLPKVTGGNGS